MSLTVGLLYNLGKYDPLEEGEPPDARAELDSEETVLAIGEAIRSAGHSVVYIEAKPTALEVLRQVPIDIAFNIAEGLRGNSRESQIPAVLEMLGIPYTGSNILTLAICLDKPTTKKILAQAGIPTPKFAVVHPGQLWNPGDIPAPYFVKPACEGSSIGIGPQSLCPDVAAARAQIEYIHAAYRQPALVEEFIDGREFTVGILGNQDYCFLPIREISFDHCPPEHGSIYSYQYKQEWDKEEYFPCPANLTDWEAARIKEVALAAYRELNCYDVGRVDVRLGRDGIPYVLEVNPLPGLAPGYSDLPQAASVAGFTYNQLVLTILGNAVERYGLQAALMRGARTA
ncbi:MAG: ATP-grasp domain-containing protein [Bacillota bacterium]